MKISHGNAVVGCAVIQKSRRVYFRQIHWLIGIAPWLHCAACWANRATTVQWTGDVNKTNFQLGSLQGFSGVNTGNFTSTSASLRSNFLAHIFKQLEKFGVWLCTQANSNVSKLKAKSQARSVSTPASDFVFFFPFLLLIKSNFLPFLYWKEENESDKR